MVSRSSKRSAPGFACVSVVGYPDLVTHLAHQLAPTLGCPPPAGPVAEMCVSVSRRDSLAVAPIYIYIGSEPRPGAPSPRLVPPSSGETPYRWLWGELERLLSPELFAYLREGYRQRNNAASSHHYHTRKGHVDDSSR